MKDFKDYPVITSEKSKDFYMIIDTLDIFYKEHIKNSKEAINIVLHFFEKFSKENNVPCGNLYVSSDKYDGEVCYFGVCDGMPDNCNELIEKYGTDYSVEFEDYCDKNGLDLDYYIEDND